jgi:pyridoxamine 5'-phosphate oxidase
MTEQHENEFLPEPLPAEPFALFDEWFALAHQRRLQPNANAMVLATVDMHGKPAARVVLCKQVIAQPGYLVFFTNYLSHKGQQLDRQHYAAVVFHWDGLHRQVRMTGPIVKSPQPESEEYFAMRPLSSQVGAWASKQSEPLASRAQLTAQIDAVLRRFNLAADATAGNVPRPPHWGGYRLWPDSVELWVEGPGRVHDRAVWTRTVQPRDEFTMNCGSWSATRLNP